MTVIPAINETDFEEIKKKIKAAQDFGTNWVHLDVSDGKFTENKLWNNPNDLEVLRATAYDLRTNLEIHLMVQNPDEVFEGWINAGAKRIIVHLESAKDLDSMKMKCAALGVELFVAVNPETSVEKLFEYGKLVDGFLILAVTPGKAGQKFSTGGAVPAGRQGSTEGGQEYQLKKIRTLRQKLLNVKIEVDGGVNLENAAAIKKAGTDILVSASYIWNGGDPKEAYRKLCEL